MPAKGKRGGARPGAGRPRTAVVHVSPIRAAEQQISARLPWLIDQQFALAEGVRVQAEKEDGSAYTYITPPCRQAIEYLVNRVMGKPVEKVEMDIRSEAERIAAEHGVDPRKVISIYERLKKAM